MRKACRQGWNEETLQKARCDKKRHALGYGANDACSGYDHSANENDGPDGITVSEHSKRESREGNAKDHH
jgi:hypothetical protein